MTENPSKRKPFHILALSGGGFRGLYSAKVLADLEEQLKCRIADKFDMLAGTSVGGITALALAYEIPAKDIVSFFETKGDTIFPKKIKWIKEKTVGIIHPKYKNSGLYNSLTQLFGETKIGDLKHRVIIPTINYATGKPQTIKTRHHKTFVRDPKLKLVDVAMATSAAPTYFPIYDNKTDHGKFVDGGLIANHPGFFALIEAYHFLDISFDDVAMLHIGTLSQKHTSDGKLQMGLWGWRKKLLDLLFSCQEQSVDQMLQFLIKERYNSIDEVVADPQSKQIGLDIVNHKARDILRDRAYESAKQYLGKDHWEMIRNHIPEKFEPIPFE
jgi:patatin-like phospholipase/acyl hydrolase